MRCMGQLRTFKEALSNPCLRLCETVERATLSCDTGIAVNTGTMEHKSREECDSAAEAFGSSRGGLT